MAKNPYKLINIFISFLLILTIISLGGIYILKIHNKVNANYSLEDYQERIEALKKGNKDLGMTVSTLQSLENITQLSEFLNMVKIDKIDYLEISKPSLVEK